MRSHRLSRRRNSTFRILNPLHGPAARFPPVAYLGLYPVFRRTAIRCALMVPGRLAQVARFCAPFIHFLTNAKTGPNVSSALNLMREEPLVYD